jgi:hypothetical protein
MVNFLPRHLLLLDGTFQHNLTVLFFFASFFVFPPHNSNLFMARGFQCLAHGLQIAHEVFQILHLSN